CAALTVVLGAVAGLGFLLADGRAEAQDGKEWGAIKGRVVWGEKTIPDRTFVKVDKDEMHCNSKGPIPHENLVINKKNNGIRWVFVWLAPVEKGEKIPIHKDLEKFDKEVV